MNEDRDKSGPLNEAELHAGDVRHPETLYDQSDLSSRGVFIFLIALAVVIVFIHLFAWGLFRFFAQNKLAPAPRSMAIIESAGRTAKHAEPALTFPAPQLQPDPVADLNKFRAAVEEQLNSYGWVDQNAGVVHIPIERAMDLVLQNGLPTRPQPVLPPKAAFAGGGDTPAGAAGGAEPKGNK